NAVGLKARADEQLIAVRPSAAKSRPLDREDARAISFAGQRVDGKKHLPAARRASLGSRKGRSGPVPLRRARARPVLRPSGRRAGRHLSSKIGPAPRRRARRRPVLPLRTALALTRRVRPRRALPRRTVPALLRRARPRPVLPHGTRIRLVRQPRAKPVRLLRPRPPTRP